MLAKLSALLAVAGLCQAQAIWQCDTLQQPNYGACDTVMTLIDWKTGNEGLMVPDRECLTFVEPPGNVGNCMIAACNERGDGARQPMNTFAGPTSYGLIKQWCEPDKAGGQSPGPGASNIVMALNNPDYAPSRRVRRATRGGLVVKQMTIEEFKALVEKAKQVNIDQLVPPTRRSQLNKRASWINFGTTKNVRSSERSRLSAIAGSGTGQEWSTTEGYSVSVSLSVGMEASLFSIFTASVSITTTLESSVSHTETVKFDPSGRCDPAQDAVLYYYPLYDYYLGQFDDSDQQYEIRVPVEGANNFAIDVECLG
ncbi:hypothetical protein CC86DRAFT_405127 [Ophiobolus disseminans]|uniref:Uncharacterized protein n=1 Tax=Ophiobolus disseminans TaxID=1469910 RepID=A0A6A7A693_9PLEO|nr:hypothetical protein CC86DRAFT_405127 [Ophiobolus disseminans]